MDAGDFGKAMAFYATMCAIAGGAFVGLLWWWLG